MPDPIPSQTFTVLPEWVDYNGHMNMGFYLVAFDYVATDPMYAWLGLGPEYRDEQSMSVFTISSSTNYLAEMFEGDHGTIDTLMLDSDGRRLHYVHSMRNTEGTLVATNELMAINVDLETRRSAKIPDDIVKRIDGVVAVHQALKRPRQVGRALGLR